jgi:hypothetical protein
MTGIPATHKILSNTIFSIMWKNYWESQVKISKLIAAQIFLNRQVPKKKWE